MGLKQREEEQQQFATVIRPKTGWFDLHDNAAAIDFEMRNNNVIRRLYMELD